MSQIDCEISDVDGSDEVLIVGKNMGDVDSTVTKYNVATKTFIKCKSPKLYRFTPHELASSNGYVFLADWSESILFVYDVKKDTWKRFRDILPKRCSAAAIIIKDKLFILGGSNKEDRAIAMIDITKWTKCTDSAGLTLMETRRHPAVVSVKDTIFVLGGRNGGNSLSTCESVDVLTGERCDLAPMIESRFIFSALLQNNQILAIGGVENSYNGTCAECFSLETRQWSFLDGMRSPYVRAEEAFLCDDQIFVMGQMKLQNRSKRIDVYDRADSTWKCHVTLPYFDFSSFTKIKI